MVSDVMLGAKFLKQLVKLIIGRWKFIYNQVIKTAWGCKNMQY